MKAVALIAGIFLLLFIHGLASQPTSLPNPIAVESTPKPNNVLDRARELISENVGIPPEAFMQEIGTLEGCRDIRVKGNVVGYLVDEEASSTQGRIVESMRAHLWEGRSMEGVIGWSFVKEQGEYTWAVVTCNQVGTATSVVVRYG